MAKDPKRPAGGFKSENTSGFLSGLVGEENPFDRRALWRLGSWGLVAVGAVTIAVMSNQSSIALRRDEVAVADLARQAQQLQSVTRESQNETRRLASAVDTLNSDRDRLYTRITVLEQGLDSVTGAIQHQNPGVSAVQANPVQAAPVPATPAPDPQVWLQNLTPAAPAVSQVATVAPKAADKPNAEARPTAKVADKPNAEAKATAKAADRPNTEPKAAEKPNTDATAPEKRAAAVLSVAPPVLNAMAAPPAPPAPLMAAKSIMAPPDPAAGKLIEPPRPETVATATLKPDADASVARDRAESEASEAELSNVAAIQRTEFGVDVGGANSIAGLRALWRGLVKTRSTAALATLRPIIVIKEGSNGLGMQLRLVAGPLGDAAAAAKICAGMTENNRPCETTVFEGQRLTIKAEDDAKSPVLKPVARKRSTQMTAPEEPKKPDPPSTLSAMFGKR
ncbi:MAG: hypothetical protein QOC84_61 [Bradyrhizobium sp.]|nr:hypothetical protein [Bradyrhizobium sp.]